MDENMNLPTFGSVQGMTSLDIAEITGKAHKNVMRDIRSLLEQGVQQLNFEPMQKQVQTNNGGHKITPYYNLTPKGCLILASGYDAKLREKIIDRLESLEKRPLPSYQEQDPIKRAELWIAEQKEKQRLVIENQAQQRMIEQKDVQIAVLSNKASYADTILSSKDTACVTQIAQDYGMSAKSFNILLRNMGIQHKVGGAWVMYAKYLHEGYVQSETFTYQRRDGTSGARMNTKWTQRGRLFLYETLKGHNVLPLIERAATTASK